MPNRIDSSQRREWLWLIGLFAVAGCYVTAPIKPSELARLDGYHDGEPKGGTVSVLSPDNRPTEIAGDSEIYLDVPGGTVGGSFRSIQVHDGLFLGVTDRGQPVQVPLGSITAARVTEPNRSVRGPLYVLLVVVGGFVVVSALPFYALAHSNCTDAHPCSGRALRVARRTVTAHAIDTAGWDVELTGAEAAPSPLELRRALARLWAESARAEHASVPAFSRLSLTLVALGAPARLVTAAHRAALEEIDHARLAFSLASAYAGEPVGPGPLPELLKARSVTAASLAELAAESLVDGCLLEGVAAEVARRALFRARDGQVQAALTVIARDEASHTDLAWEVVEWCCEKGGDPVRRSLTTALTNAPASVTPPDIPGELADHGWLGAGAWEEAFRATAATVAARVAELQRQQPTNVVADGSTEVGDPPVTTILDPIRAATAPLRGSGKDASAHQASSAGS
jgi:hypothetical protein